MLGVRWQVAQGGDTRGSWAGNVGWGCWGSSGSSLLTECGEGLREQGQTKQRCLRCLQTAEITAPWKEPEDPPVGWGKEKKVGTSVSQNPLPPGWRWESNVK